MSGLCALVGACEQFQTSFQYLGERRLSDTPLRVRTVFWPPEGAIAFAVEDVSEGPPVMHMVPVSGAKPCRAGPVSRFAAITNEDGGFHLALLDRDGGRIRFYDADCQLWQPDIERVDDLELRSGRDGHRFLVGTEDARVFIVDPETERATLLAEDVERVGSGMLRPEGHDAFWVLAGDTLSVLDGFGKVVGPVLEGISRFANYQGPGTDQETHAYVVVQRGRELGLLDMTGPAYNTKSGDAFDVWEQEDSCGPRIEAVRAVCATEGCRIEGDGEGAKEAARGRLPWVSFFSPCDSRRLVLRTDDPHFEPIPIADEVESYRLLDVGVEGQPVVVFRVADEDTDFVQIAGGETYSLDARVDLDSVRIVASFLMLSFVTDEDSPRLILWTPEDGSEEILTGVAQLSSSGLVLHDFDWDTEVGRLSFCGLRRCATVAEGVPRQRYRNYETVERIGDPIPVIAYLHDVDVDADARVGVLSVLNRVTGEIADVAGDVSDFAPVELGGARGVIYTVPDGKRRGLWYAPR